LNHVWGYDFSGGLRTVDAHIRRLRSKIGAAAPDVIETIRNVGYRIP
ncbi:MAG: winged helix-turn-helix domain-containing protein, partial [Dehalococcoidia bacterium]